MPASPTVKRGRGWGRARLNRRGVLLRNHKTLEDLIDTHVLVKPARMVGYVWGGRPQAGIDVPDILYVTIRGNDYEVKASDVEPAFVQQELPKELPLAFENTSGDADPFEKEAAS